MLQLPDGFFAYDPADRSPLSAAAECITALLGCFAPPERNLAGCLSVVPICKSDTPWIGDAEACCPPACLDRYQTLRRAGLSPANAISDAVWTHPSCMPGVVGRGAPEEPSRGVRP